MNTPAVGSIIGPLEIGPVAHGGHCVARHEGRVVFVRHAIPGELVTVQLTEVGKKSFWRGDAHEVVRASEHRVPAPCAVAGECGGCDFQHVAWQHQRELKRRVVAEQLQRLAGITWDGTVEQVGVSPLGWRSRMRYVTETGQAGLRRYRSHDVVELPATGCLIAAETLPVDDLHVLAREAAGDDMVVAAADPISAVAGGEVLTGHRVVRQRVAGRVLSVAADGFWQPHQGAPGVLTTAVMDALQPRAGETALDLYCGVGLFASTLVDAGLRVLGVEMDRRAASWAARNLPEAEIIAGPLERNLGALPSQVDLVVLDPPRAGAGARVVPRLAALEARAIAYVACDPAALARDLATFASLGWQARKIRAFDLFPMTHHVECVALLVPDGRGDASAS